MANLVFNPIWKISLLSSIIFLSACSRDESVISDDDSNTSISTTGITITDTNTVATAEGNTDTAENADDLLANSTFEYNVSIAFSGSSAVITNPYTDAGVSVTQSNGDVVVNSTISGVSYTISGTTTNGSLKIYSDKKFKLVLNNANITNNDGPAINIQSGKRVFVVLNDGSTNSLADSSSYTIADGEDAKGTFFSEGQLIFSGTGTLNVKGNYKHGIVSDDYIRIIDGTINVTGAATDGIHTNDAFIADGGTLNITASSDGIECEEGYIVINDGSFTLKTGDDGIAASYDTDSTIDPYVTINGGTFNITSTGGEGIESKSTLTINNGTITINAYDDAINAGTAIYINGGITYAASSTNDGIDSNGTLTVTGGYTIAAGASAPETGFDNDNNTFKITGGTIIGIGGSTSTPTANVSTQRSVILGSGSANQLIHIQSADKTEALTFLIPKGYSTMLYSSAKLQANTSYTIYTGGSVTNGTNINGLYTSGTYSGGSQSSTFNIGTSMVTRVGGR
ncbi:MAG: carbohydrate-binding domain-containing protein [Cruoricaptor ignavus]|nr:carbohydrate-binding domain-containing protein [Cruoricaptor ignavus]